MGACEKNNELGSELEAPEAPEPDPIHWAELDRWSLTHRRIYCVYYDWCLTAAVRKNWRGWSCCECLVRDEWRENER